MTALWLVLLIPMAGMVLQAFIGHHRHAGWVNVTAPRSCVPCGSP
jgi:hypothetical protein